MKTIIMMLFIASMAIGSISTAKAQRLSDSKKSSIEKEIDAVFNTAVAAAEQMDIEKLNKTVDDRHRAGFITNGNYYPEFDVLMNNFKSRAQNVNGQKITVKTKKITVLSDDIALLTASGETLIDLASQEPITAHFFWSFVYQKIDNEWKVIQSHQSNAR